MKGYVEVDLGWKKIWIEEKGMDTVVKIKSKLEEFLDVNLVQYGITPMKIALILLLKDLEKRG